MKWDSFTFFLVGLTLGAGGVWILNATQKIQGAIAPLSPLTNYFQSIPPIDTSTALKEP